MDGNKAVTATFTQDNYDTTVTVVGTGCSVTNAPGNPYTYGQTATLTPVADVGWTFSAWSGTNAGELVDAGGGDWTLVMDGNKAVTATFTRDEYTVTSGVVGSGSIARDPNQATYHYGDSVELTATADTGWTFAGWSGDLTGSTNPDSLLVTDNMNVTATFTLDQLTISGHLLEPDDTTAIEGIRIEMSDSADSDITDPNGYYELTVDYGWSGIVEPNAVGYMFDPNEAGRTLTNVTSDTVLDLTGYLEAFIISGTILEDDAVTPIEGVTVTPQNGGGYYTAKYDGGGIGVIDPNGYYEVLVDYDWSGDVTPTHNAYVFDPNKLTYNNVKADSADQDYAGTMLTYMITGCVKNSGDVPIAGVLVNANNGGTSDTTETDGLYEIWVDYNFSGTVTPTKNNYSFDPNWIEYTDVLGDEVDQDYSATNIYDLDFDGSIGIGDLRIISENWLSVGIGLSGGDFYNDQDDIINFLDFADFANVWGD